MPELTDRDRAAYAERQKFLRDHGIIPDDSATTTLAERKEADWQAYLADPAGWIEGADAEARGAELDEAIRLNNLPDEQPADLIAESNIWLARAEREKATRRSS